MDLSTSNVPYPSRNTGNDSLDMEHPPVMSNRGSLCNLSAGSKLGGMEMSA